MTFRVCMLVHEPYPSSLAFYPWDSWIFKTFSVTWQWISQISLNLTDFHTSTHKYLFPLLTYHRYALGMPVLPSSGHPDMTFPPPLQPFLNLSVLFNMCTFLVVQLWHTHIYIIKSVWEVKYKRYETGWPTWYFTSHELKHCWWGASSNFEWSHV